MWFLVTISINFTGFNHSLLYYFNLFNFKPIIVEIHALLNLIILILSLHSLILYILNFLKAQVFISFLAVSLRVAKE